MEVVGAVAVEGDVAGPLVEVRGLDPAAPNSGGHALDVRPDVGPGDAAVAGELDVAVVGADPEEAGKLRRFRDGDDGAVGLGARDVGRHAAGRARPVGPVLRGVLGLVVHRQVGADDHPVVAPVGRPEQVVAAEVERLGIVRRKDDRRAPVEAEGAAVPLLPRGRAARNGRGRLGFGLGRRGLLVGRCRREEFLVVEDGLRGRPDLLRLARLDVDPLDGAALALAVGGAPVGRIVLGMETVAAADVEPEVGQQLALAVRRRAAPGPVVLEAAVDVIGVAHVGADGVELGHGQVVEEDPGLAVVVAERGAAVLADVETVLVGWVEPHGVEVGVEAADLVPGLAAVGRVAHIRGQPVDPLVLERVDVDVAVVEGPVVLPAHERPGGAAVLGAVDARPELGHVLVLGVRLLIGPKAGGRLEAVLDDGRQDVRVGAGDGQADAAELARGQSLGELRPGLAAVGRLEDAAVRAAGVEAPGLAEALPHGDEEGLRFGRVHDQVDGPGLAVVRQAAGELGPRRAAVGRLEQAPVARVAPGVA